MEQINKVLLRGTVGAVRVNELNGSAVAWMSLATNYAYRDKDGNAVIETTWHELTAFGSKNIDSDVLRSVQKGDRIEVTGRIRSNRYTGPDGETRYGTEIVCSVLKKIDPMESLEIEM